MAAKSKKTELFPRLVQMNKDGMTIGAACRELGVHPVTATGWFKSEGVEPVRVRTGRHKDPESRETVSCEQCGTEINTYKSRPRRFCSIECTNLWQKENRSAFKVCECGNRITMAEGATTMYSYRKYCSDACREKYGKKRQKNPENWRTATCRSCGTEFELRKSSQSYGMFCSNECAAKHTKTVRHYVVRETDMVLDSGWEMLFAGLCYWHKVHLERYQRTAAVEWSPGHWYAPDFDLSLLGLAVEVKGQEDDDDPQRWTAYRSQVGSLVVVDEILLDRLRLAPNATDFLTILATAATKPSEAH